MGQVFVTRVRQPETPLWAPGHHVLPRARAVPERWPRLTPRSAEPRGRLDTQLTAALAAHQRIASHSRRLTQGTAWRHGNIVTAYAPTMAPMGQGQRHGPAQLGRTPGLIAEPAAGVICARHLPVGHPGDVTSVEPLGDHVPHAIARGATRPTPALHARAGDLACTDGSWREARPAQGMLTGGIPQTGAPLPPSPSPEAGPQILSAAGWQDIRTPTPVQLAYAWGESRPVVERLMASRLCRGAAPLTYKGHRGAIVHTGMAVMAPHAATVVRIHA